MDVFPLPGIGEPFASLSHLAGAIVFACLGVPLVRRGGGDRGRMAFLALFAIASVVALALSASYHASAPVSGARDVLRRLDHAGIFLLIAASFITGHGILFRGAWRGAVITLMTACAVAGIVQKTLFFETVTFKATLGIYLGMGWLGVISAVIAWHRFGWRFVSPIAWGGAAYTAAALIEVLEAPNPLPGIIRHHELVHLLVLAGLSSHWRFMLGIANGGFVIASRSEEESSLALLGADAAPGHLPETP